MFGDVTKRFTREVRAKERRDFHTIVDLAHESVQSGSVLTGAPGQPVDRGVLKASWLKSYPDPHTGQIATNVEYAPYIEDGANSRGPFTLRSKVGGFHSEKLTIANFDNIVEHVRNGSPEVRG